MSCKVELIPITEGNHITIKEDEKIIVGRGSSLGCTDKKISRHHAELLLKKEGTLVIKPTHTNPVFYRPLNGKTVHLTKDVEQELKDGDQIGLLPTSYFFRVSITKDSNKTTDEHPGNGADNHTDISSVQSKDSNQSEPTSSDQPARKLPTWMTASTSSSSPKKTASTSLKRQLSEEADQSKKTDDTSNQQPSMSDTSSTAKPVDSDNGETFDSVPSKKRTLQDCSPSSSNGSIFYLDKSQGKPRVRCPYGKSCYRKNPAHRAEQSHPGDSDCEDDKETEDEDKKSDDADKPSCPYGKSCYRQNPQHKREYKH
ncbi:unnamed protein product [Adineta ricciae]|uniref:Aprataxin and PNK-like factor n=1 Tax=Adineta ricciae TaxID=249248 RepID=A0A815CL42_ADIRI|nr:unnamed protein product [Adineta ricciae]